MIATFVAGHNVHNSLEAGLTVCGKRTEGLEQAGRWATCQYCIEHTPTKRTGVDALASAIRSTK